MVRKVLSYVATTLVLVGSIAAVGLEPATKPAASRPSLPGKLHVADICRIRVEHNRLVLHSTFPATGRVFKTGSQFEDLPGNNSIRVDIEPGSDLPQMFYLINNYSRTPGAALLQTQITLTDGSLVIHQHSQINNGWRIVSITQGQQAAINNGFGNAGPDAIVLNVMNSNDPEHRFTCVAADWVALCRSYRAEVDQYLRPLLRTLRQEAVFGIEPVVAWQIFTEEWKDDPAVGQRVTRSLPALGSDDFNEREAASAALRREGIAGALFLRSLGTSRFSPEQNARIDGVLSDYTILPAQEAEKLRNDPAFLVDCLYSEEAAVRAAALRRLAKVSGRAIKFDVDASEAERSDAVNSLRAEILPTPATQPQ